MGDNSGSLNFDEFKIGIGAFAATNARVVIDAYDVNADGILSGSELSAWKTRSNPLDPSGDGPSLTPSGEPSRLPTLTPSWTVTSTLAPWPKSPDSSSWPPTSSSTKWLFLQNL